MAVTSLTALVMISLLEQLEYISSLSLMALPTMLRKQLMIKYLPIADILLMESAQITKGIDMNTLWRELLLHRLSDVIKSSRDLQRKVRSYNGSWRELYLEILWNQVLSQSMDQFTTSNFLQKTRQIFVRVVRIDCQHTKLLDLLFGVDVKAIPGTRSSGSLRRMYGICCPSCRNSTFIPRRYIMHYAERNNRFSLVYYLSMFWVYGHYRPKQITINTTRIKKYGGGRSLSTSILSQYPNILSTVLTSVRDISLVPVYMNSTQLDTLTALSTGLARSIDSLTLDLTSITDPQLQLISAQHLPHTAATKLMVLNKLDLERQHNKNVFLEQVIAHYATKLQELVLHGVPLTVNTSEVLVLSICGLYSRKRFQGLHLFDAELSVEVMIMLMRHFLSSKYNQQLELNSLRVYQYTDTIPMITTGSGPVSNTRQKSLALVKMYSDVFAGEPLFDALNAMPLEKLTITADMASILKNYEEILVTELVLKVDDFKENSNLHLKGVVTKSGIERIAMEVVLDDWVTSIHSQSNQQVSKTVMDDVVVAMEIAANCGKLSKLRFRSKDHESRILGSSNPLAIPEGTMSLIFNRIFAFPNLHVLSFDLLNFDASSLVQIIVGAWSSRANGVRIKEIVISKFENQLLLVKEPLEEICNNLVLKS